MFQIEYDGEYREASTLNAALDWATQVVTDRPGQIDGATIEEDHLTSTWYVQAVVDGHKVGATAVVSDSDAGVPPGEPIETERPARAGRRRARPAPNNEVDFDGWSRLVVISGATPAEAFRKAAHWLGNKQDSIRISAVHTVNRRTKPQFVLEIYFE